MLKWDELTNSKKGWLMGLVVALMTGAMAAVPPLTKQIINARITETSAVIEHREWLVERTKRDADASWERLKAERVRCDSCCRALVELRFQRAGQLRAQQRAAQRLRKQNERQSAEISTLTRQLQGVLSKQKAEAAP